MLKLADLEEMTDYEVYQHIITSYADDGDNGYGRSGSVVTEDSIRELLKKYHICVAYESVGSWGCDSSSYFILRNKETGEYAFTQGGHCSCYGFEGQFEPEEMPVEWFLREDFLLYGFGGYDDDEEENRRKTLEWIQKNMVVGEPDELMYGPDDVHKFLEHHPNIPFIINDEVKSVIIDNIQRLEQMGVEPLAATTCLISTVNANLRQMMIEVQRDMPYESYGQIVSSMVDDLIELREEKRNAA